MTNKKKYILKPGKHQFAPKSPAVHTDENLTDAEAEWYLDRYPHIKSLFIRCRQPFQSSTAQGNPPSESVKSPAEIGVITNNQIGEISQKETGVTKENNNEDLSATN
ncbi:hypothetical protein [Mucilaginibacter sp.]|jgi:hypothetical protein|uniref:hypothetical protein n=1 Tax=Mucilaginibacter sp. TaxID=1882438 RepID=UPI002B6AA5B2|nr:hypothetical protein [Mucilaginibacter sp.]HTI58431.1 hypothetical protein [Mucilaginibacter sp.]